MTSANGAASLSTRTMRNGDGLPPPSTLAAQIVINQSKRDVQDSRNRELFAQLLRGYLSNEYPEELDLAVNSQLVAVICKAGLDVLSTTDPFLPSSLVPQAIDSLTVIRKVLEKTPDLLFYADAQFQSGMPLAVWIFPKIMSLIGVPQLQSLENGIVALLASFVGIYARSSETWQNALAIENLYRSCVDGIAISFDPHKSGDTSRRGFLQVSLPPSDGINELWPPAKQLLALPGSCQFSINDAERAVAIASTLLKAVDSFQLHATNSCSNLATLFYACSRSKAIWDMESLNAIWQAWIFQQSTFRPAFNETFLNFMLGHLENIKRRTSTFPFPHPSRGDRLHFQVLLTCLRLCMAGPVSDSLTIELGRSLLGVLERQKSLGRSMHDLDDSLYSLMSQVCTNENDFKSLPEAIQSVLCVWLCIKHDTAELSTWTSMRVTELKAKQELAFGEENLKLPFVKEDLPFGELDLSMARLPKRRKLSKSQSKRVETLEAGDDYLVRALTSRLTGEEQSSLAKLENSIGQVFADGDEDSRMVTLDMIAEVACKRTIPRDLSGHSHETNLGALSHFRFCPAHVVTPKDAAHRVRDAQDNGELASILEKFVSCKRLNMTHAERVQFAVTLKIVLTHSGAQSAINLKSELGQWTLKSLRSSHRELRIAAGQTLVAFLGSSVPETMRKSNRIIALDFIRRILAKEEIFLLETLIIALKQIAKTCGDEEQHIVLLQFVDFLGHTNPVVCGIAHAELVSLAESLGRTPEEMFRPFWRTIAITVVKDLQSRPQKVQQLCYLLDRSVAQFLVMTQVYTLPYLVWTKNIVVLQRIASAASTSVKQLCSGSGKNLAAILAFLLAKHPTNTEGVVSELLQNAAPEFAQLDLQVWLSFEPVMIACEMFKFVAEVEERKKPEALSAIESLIMLVEKKSGTSTSQRTKTKAAFFQAHVLGIMAHFSEVIDASREYHTISERRRCLRALEEMVAMAGKDISVAVPQVRACLQSALELPELRDDAFSAWSTLVSSLEDEDMESLLGHTFSVIAQCWNDFSESSQNLAFETVIGLTRHRKNLVVSSIATLPSLATIPKMSPIETSLNKFRSELDASKIFEGYTARCRDETSAVVLQALRELMPYLENHQGTLHEAAIQQPPPPFVSSLCRSILDASVKFTETSPEINELCAQALGIIGCLDPFRVESVRQKNDILLLTNFERVDEVVDFVVFLLETVIVKAFHSSTNARAQGFLAYTMQELLNFCEFRQVATYRPRSSQLDTGVYQRWNRIPPLIRETLTPFLSSYYKVETRVTNVKKPEQYPIFKSRMGHGAWLRSFVSDLLQRGKGESAKRIFSVLGRIIRGHDLSIPSTLLPVAVLNVVIGGTEEDANDILLEFLTILTCPFSEEDQSRAESIKQCSENVLRVLDYLRRWLQKKRKNVLDSKAAFEKSGRAAAELEHQRDVAQISSVDRILSEIPAEDISNRAVACGSYAQALFHWENHVRQRKERSPNGLDVVEHDQLYRHLQHIYSQIDEPDGIEGISAHLQVLQPEQQILEHKRAGRWAAVQSWHEIELASRPEDVSVQLGLLSCLKDANQYDSLLNNVERFRKQSPAFLSRLAPYAAQASWICGKWDYLQEVLDDLPDEDTGDFNVGVGRALISLRNGQTENFSKSLTLLRKGIARGMTSTSTSSLQASHDQLFKLHSLYEIETICGVHQASPVAKELILKRLDARLNVLGAFTADKEFLLGLRRATMQLSRLAFTQADIASVWSTSAKLARKADRTDDAFNAVLHAVQLGDEASKVEHSKLLWKVGQRRKAIQNLQGAMAAREQQRITEIEEQKSTVISDQAKLQTQRLSANATLLYAKWLDAAGQTASAPLLKQYREAVAQFSRWEKGQYYLGSYYNKNLEANKQLPVDKQSQPYLTGELAKLVIEAYLRSMGFGAKYYNQTVPKVLTLWLELGLEVHQAADRRRSHSARVIDEERTTHLETVHGILRRYLVSLPAFVFYTAYQQIITRISHPNKDVFKVLLAIITKIIGSHPQQALWGLYPVVKSSDPERAERGKAVVLALREAYRSQKNAAVDLKSLINHGQKLTDMLLTACEVPLEGRVSNISLQRDLSFRHNLAPCNLVVPIEATILTTLPTSQGNSEIKGHKAFPASRTITIQGFKDDVLVLNSLQKPRKLTIVGSDGNHYGLLCKPKDDLRKDQRLMDFNAEIGRALQRDAESRRRRLYIHTYAVTPLNEECGAIEWVDGLRPIRDIIIANYKQKNVRIDYNELRQIYETMQAPAGAGGNIKLFADVVQPKFQPVLHEWFVETFPDPEAWFAARLRFTRSCAVMSIVGHVLGLGDRHGENILLETGNGGVFHVDFNCLFDKGLTFDKPELVPFRLTDNMVDAFGASGVEGAFRIAAELTLSTLRNCRAGLMTILETFLYDPVVDFVPAAASAAAPKRKRHTPGVPDTPQAVLDSVGAKLKGLLRGESVPLGVEGYVDALIVQATDRERLARMYIGWCAYF